MSSVFVTSQSRDNQVAFSLFARTNLPSGKQALLSDYCLFMNANRASVTSGFVGSIRFFIVKALYFRKAFLRQGTEGNFR